MILSATSVLLMLYVTSVYTALLLMEFTGLPEIYTTACTVIGFFSLWGVIHVGLSRDKAEVQKNG